VKEGRREIYLWQGTRGVFRTQTPGRGGGRLDDRFMRKAEKPRRRPQVMLLWKDPAAPELLGRRLLPPGPAVAGPMDDTAACAIGEEGGGGEAAAG
jgi:hypothetical protein